jgi:hypothetical protein
VKRVITLDGWKRRARGSGGYNGRAKGVSHHHDAGGRLSDGLPAAMYETFTAPARPIANLHLSRGAEVFVMAGGATNTIGAGGPMGDFAKDQGNAWQIGIEAGNTGLGEVWPADEVRAYIEMSAQLWIAYHEPFGWALPLNLDQFFDHRRWAPGRKIDRKGEAICEFNGREIVFARGYSYWDTELYYEVVTERIEQIIAPPPQPKPDPPIVVTPTPTDPTKGYTVTPGRNTMDILIEYGEDKDGLGTADWYHALKWGAFGLEWLEKGESANTLKQAGAARISVDRVNGTGDGYILALIEDNGTYGPSPYFPGGKTPNATLHEAWLRKSRGGL